VVESMPTFG